MIILGIESSCDDTSAAVVQDGRLLLSCVVASSMDLHTQYGGVIPEIAARSHIESIIPVIDQTLRNAAQAARWQDDPWNHIDGIAVTYGAGLIGSLLIGVMTARTLAVTKKKPLYGINHVEAHVYANFITKSLQPGIQTPAHAPDFPMLALIVSGGHSQLVLFRDHFEYTLIGQTQDDAVGEAFDKVAKILGLPYPGGLSVSKLAADGDAHAYTFPKARMQNKYDFSFSGLKTAVLRAAQTAVGSDFTLPSVELPKRLNDAQKADFAASFQRIAVETVVDKTVMAFQEFNPASVVIAGGVAASQELRRQLSERIPLPIEYADPKLCTDNGAMVAALGCYYARENQPLSDPLSLEPDPGLSM